MFAKHKIDFVKKYMVEALLVEHKTGLHHLCILAQAAVESAWGQSVFGNNFFGVKDSDGQNGNEQLLRTWEYISNPSQASKFPVVLSMVKVGERLWKLRVRDWFRTYPSAEACFREHADFFIKRPRYKQAWGVRDIPNLFFEAIHKAGYATAPNYAAVLNQTANEIKEIFDFIAQQTQKTK